MYYHAKYQSKHLHTPQFVLMTHLHKMHFLCQICAMQDSGRGWTVHDSEQKVPYYTDGSLWVGFDDEISIAIKVGRIIHILMPVYTMGRGNNLLLLLGWYKQRLYIVYYSKWYTLSHTNTNIILDQTQLQ